MQWDVISGQPIRSLPAHTLGIVSLSVPALGEVALYNTLEGTTALWDLQSGEIKGEFASYMAKKDGREPGTSFQCVEWRCKTVKRLN